MARPRKARDDRPDHLVPLPKIPGWIPDDGYSTDSVYSLDEIYTKGRDKDGHRENAQTTLPPSVMAQIDELVGPGKPWKTKAEFYRDSIHHRLQYVTTSTTFAQAIQVELQTELKQQMIRQRQIRHELRIASCEEILQGVRKLLDHDRQWDLGQQWMDEQVKFVYEQVEDFAEPYRSITKERIDELLKSDNT